MKLNNKGFAISGVLYPIFVLFLILLFGTISNLATAKAVIDRNKIDIEKQLNGDNVNPYFVMDGHDITITTGYSYTPTTGVKAYSSEGKELGLEQITVISEPVFNNNLDGVYNITYSVTDARGRTTIDSKKITVAAQMPSIYNYTGDVQTFTTTKKGIYKVELWGAQGGSGGGTGGFGGYTRGDIDLDSNVSLFVYVGGVGGNRTSTTTQGAAGYNGGGIGGLGTPPGWGAGAGGGGATDVRLSNGVWNDILGLRSRIMIAGGGGGSGASSGAMGHAGGYGGGVHTYGGAGGNGINGAGGGGAGGYYGAGGAGGWSGGAGGTAYSTNTSPGYVGSFGIGAQGGGVVTANYDGGGGGGGGYYGGGGGGGGGGGSNGAGGGGSQFISGHTGSNAIDSLGAHTGQPDHYSGYVFKNTTMQDGIGYLWTTVRGLQQQMPKPTGDLYPLGSGHMGHGFAEITPLLTINIE